MKKYRLIISLACIAMTLAGIAQTPASQKNAMQNSAPKSDALFNTIVGVKDCVATVRDFTIEPTGTGGRVATPVGPRKDSSHDTFNSYKSSNDGVLPLLPDGVGGYVGTPIKPRTGSHIISSDDVLNHLVISDRNDFGLLTDGNNSLPVKFGISSERCQGIAVAVTYEELLQRLNGLELGPLGGGGRVHTPIDPRLGGSTRGLKNADTGEYVPVSSSNGEVLCSSGSSGSPIMFDLDQDGIISINDVHVSGMIESLLRGDVSDWDCDFESNTEMMNLLLNW
jgi:hypothetical protein